MCTVYSVFHREAGWLLLSSGSSLKIGPSAILCHWDNRKWVVFTFMSVPGDAVFCFCAGPLCSDQVLPGNHHHRLQCVPLLPPALVQDIELVSARTHTHNHMHAKYYTFYRSEENAANILICFFLSFFCSRLPEVCFLTCLELN